ATFFSVSGPPIQAMLNVNKRTDGTALNFGNQLVSLLPALWNQTLLGNPVSTSYGERLNQFDFRVAKVFKMHKTRSVINFDIVNLIILALPVRVEWRQGPAPVQSSSSARAEAPIDLTGYWVSVVTEDWRWRMLVPPKGDYTSVPLNPAGRRAADAWDPARIAE